MFKLSSWMFGFTDLLTYCLSVVGCSKFDVLEENVWADGEGYASLQSIAEAMQNRPPERHNRSVQARDRGEVEV